MTMPVEELDQFEAILELEALEPVHLTLERYVSVAPADGEHTLEKLEEYENIIYGNRLNAQFFIDWVLEHQALEAVRNTLNLVLDQETADLLEEQGIPAIQPQEQKPIGMMEFILRFRRMGLTLYPCGSHRTEEIPGLLEELDIPVNEFEVYERVGPEAEELESYRRKVEEYEPDMVLFHSRRSVNKILAAFPDLDLGNKQLLLLGPLAEEKLREHVENPGKIIVVESVEGLVQEIDELL